LPFRKDGAIIYLMALFLLVGFFLLSGLFSSASAFTYQIPAIQDSYIDSGSSTGNYGGVQAGEINTGSSVRRGFIKFGLDFLAYKTINSANLKLYLASDDYTNNDRTLSVYRVLRNWTDTGVTWNKYDGVNNWQTAGASGSDDIDSTVLGTYSLTNPPADGYITIPLNVAVLNSMLSTLKNYGFLIKVNTEVDDLYVFYGYEYKAGTRTPILELDVDDASVSGGVSIVEPDSDTKSAIENYDKVFGTALVLAMFSFGYLIFRDSFHA